MLPCSQCNADGTLHGFNHVKAWEKESSYQPPAEDNAYTLQETDSVKA
jgi:hypothetical protein